MHLPAALRDLPPDRPVLLAGPTASGKSALALALAEQQGGIIVNADALQVFDGWRILTARPTQQDESRAPHALYGHLPLDATYSVGQWLADLEPLLSGPQRPIITGGTGLYFTALTQGLAVIPPTPPAIRATGDSLTLAALLGVLDHRTRARIDTANRARVQRAWEVLTSTGRPLADWQDDTPKPRLPLSACTPVVLRPSPDWLNARIATRFDAMLAEGALQEARAILPLWNPAHLSSRAIGAAELVAHLRGQMSLDDARAAAIIATRQYAKRQRTWFRNRMAGWSDLTPAP
jgi:tRNA dimethylallyltransferase